MYGVSIELITNYKSLKYIFMEKDLHSSQCKWLEFLTDYDIDIAYHPDHANVIDRHLVAALVRLTINSTISDCIR